MIATVCSGHRMNMKIIPVHMTAAAALPMNMATHTVATASRSSIPPRLPQDIVLCG